MANYAKKQDNTLMKVVKYIIPWKGDKPVEIIRKVIFLISALVLIISLTSLIVYEGRRAAGNNADSDIAAEYDSALQQEQEQQLSGGTGSMTLQGGENAKPEDVKPVIMERFKTLIEKNDDIVGWITMGEADAPFVHYPVVQGEDNDFYLDHNFEKEKNLGGSIFTDYREPITADSEPANIILYGHNMASGEYFGKVTKYFNYKPGRDPSDISFYQTYPTFTFSTLYEEHTYKIFGGMLVNTKKSEGDVFYYLRGRNFETKADFDEYIAKILDRSTFYTDVDLKYGDRLITLSTCILDYGDWDLRWVLFARRVREGEDPTVDVSKAYYNPDPLYFDAYYKYFGGSWGGRKWPAEMIFGYEG
ncbi:MAG: class B sortase [Ruminococcaceae bacterium]|nr:class B sortase [Oscillospiraceae bacterium]